MFRDTAPLHPLHFFEIECSCFYSENGEIGKKKYLLPDTTSYLPATTSLAKVYVGYREDALFFRIQMDGPIYSGNHPLEESIELFLDTRAQPNRKYAGPFSHHFLITFQPFEGSYVREVSRFSGESHTLCNPSDLSIHFEKKMRSSITNLTIPSFALHGFMPKEFPEWRFTYKIQKASGEVQYFTCHEEEVNIWQNAYLWAKLHLK